MATSTQASRSIYNTFDIDADYIDFNGQPGSGDDVHLTAHAGSKFILESDTQVPEGKKFLVSQVCDKNGVEIFSKDETNNRIKFNVPIDLNNNALVNNPGGGGGSGPTTTSAISSENLSGQTLEDELDALTAQQTANTNSITTLNTNVATNTSSIGTLNTNVAANTSGLTATNLQVQTNTLATTANAGAITGLQTTQGTLNTNVSALQATATAHTSDIAALQGNDTTQDTNITNLQTTQGTQATSITNLQTTQGTQATDITNLQTAAATALTDITNLQTTQGTQATSITNLSTQQATNTGNITTNTTNITTNTGNITALTTQQNLNTAAIASNTARTSNLTADRILISSAVGTINTAGIGVTDVATKNSGNSFNAPLGNPPTQNSFDTITASTVTNTGTTESASYTQGGAALNFSHLAGSATTAQLPTQVVRTDVPDQTIQGNAASSSLTKVTLDNTHATGTSQLALQKRSTGGVLEGGISIIQTTSGTSITGQAPSGQNPDISITPANGSLAMTIGGLESRFHNNLKIIGSLSGAARSDNKNYIFRTIGSTGAGDVLLEEDVLKRPTTGVPAQGFNPSNSSLIEYSSLGVPSYKETSNFLIKPSNSNPSVPSFIEVQTGGGFAYRPSTFIPLPGGALPSANENVVFVNPAGTSYVNRSNLIERPGNANPTSGTKLITINNVGTRAYKDLGQFITTPSNANPSADSVVQISSTGVQSYVAVSSLGGGGIQKPGGSNPGQPSLVSLDAGGTETYLAESNLVKTTVASQTISTTTAAANFTLSCGSTTLADETTFRVERTGGVGDNFIEFVPKRGTFAEWRTKNDLRVLVNGQTKLGIGNHTVDFFKPLVMQNGHDIRLQQTFVAPANSSSTGSFGTIGFDSTHLYIAVGTNSWKRVALSTF